MAAEIDPYEAIARRDGPAAEVCRLHCAKDDIVAGNRYRVDVDTDTFVPDDSGPWLALVTYRGPKAPPRPEVLPVGTHREPARTIHGQVVGDPAEVGSATIAQPTDGLPPLGAREQAIVDRLAALGWECGRRFCDAPLTRGSVRVWLRASGPEICGGPKFTRGESTYSGPADARLYHTALGQALDAIEATAPPVEIPGESSGVPDYAHPRAALRTRTFVVPTDLDDHLIPDAEPGWGGPR